MSITKIKNALMVCGAIMTAAVFMIGCGDDDDDKGGCGGNPVLGTDEAWVMYDDFLEDTIGLIFKSNGEYISLTKNNGLWEEDYTDTYSTSGGEITLNMGDFGYTVDYCISGNKLTLGAPFGMGEDEVYTKTSGVTFFNGVPIGGELVLGVNEAWVGADHFWDGGIIFKQNGECLFIRKNNNETVWEVSRTRTYSISGSQLTIDYYGDDETFGYSVINNNTVAVFINPPWDFGNVSYTKTTGVTVSNSLSKSKQPLSKESKTDKFKKHRWMRNAQ